MNAGITLRIGLYVVAALLAAAHFLRAGDTMLLVLSLVAPLLFRYRRRWSLILLQLMAYCAAANWILVAARIVEQRQLSGTPWTTAAIILGGVAAYTCLAGLLLNSRSHEQTLRPLAGGTTAAHGHRRPSGRARSEERPCASARLRTRRRGRQRSAAALRSLGCLGSLVPCTPGPGSLAGPVVGRRLGFRQRLRRLEPGCHRCRSARHHLVVIDVEHPQPALLAESESDRAAQFHQFRLAEMPNHPIQNASSVSSRQTMASA